MDAVNLHWNKGLEAEEAKLYKDAYKHYCKALEMCAKFEKQCQDGSFTKEFKRLNSYVGRFKLFHLSETPVEAAQGYLDEAITSDVLRNYVRAIEKYEKAVALLQLAKESEILPKVQGRLNMLKIFVEGIHEFTDDTKTLSLNDIIWLILAFLLGAAFMTVHKTK
jgi:hypothetical protein